MSYRVSRLNEAVKYLDSALEASITPQGMIQLHRVIKRNDRIYQDEAFGVQKIFILALTDNWHASGTPVERGIEQVLFELRSRDTWAQDRQFEEMKRRREMKDEDEKRQKKNELRAIAADMRTDFAKATNDIVVRR